MEVAVVGSRRFADGTGAPDPLREERRIQTAKAACREVWRAIAQALRSSLALPVEIPRQYWPADVPVKALTLGDFFSGEPPRLGVISALAAGADQFAAEAASEALGGAWGTLSSSGVLLELEAILPFAEASYPGPEGQPREEFTVAEAEKLRRLCDKARQTVRLDGVYQVGTDADRDSAASREARHQAYRDARDMIFENSDLVLAVLDDRAQEREAGTRESIRIALERELPVLLVRVGDEATRIVLLDTPAAWIAEQKQAPGGQGEESESGWQERVVLLVHYLLALPHMRPAQGEHGPSAAAEAERFHALGTAVGRLWLYFGRTPGPPVCCSPSPRWLVRPTWRTLVHPAKAVEDLWKWTCERCGSRSEAAGPGKGGGAPSASAGHTREAREPEATPYTACSERASRLSRLYMGTYRGAFVWTYLLAGLAVAAAVGAFAVMLLHHGHAPLAQVVPFGVAKLLFIGGLLWIVASGRRHRYQELAADFRYLSELLRPMGWLGQLGTAVPSIELPAQYRMQDPRQGWTQWLFRAVARTAPAVIPLSSARAITLDRTTALRTFVLASHDWVCDQIDYHHRNAADMGRLERRLETLGNWLLGTVIVCAIDVVLIEVALARGLADDPEWARRIMILLGALAATLPAFIAALGGILVQSEAKRLRIRSEAMRVALCEEKAEIEASILELASGAPIPRAVAWAAAQRLRGIAGLMIAETGDWRALYPVHDLKAG